ncbi:MAG TPA: SRPBCC family protein [Stellaceae bacterium]|nr:SRPBCC family protein [Stellaceae bacterium]
MADRTAQHASFVIEHDYDATPARVFHAFADPAAKRRWFHGPVGKWTEISREQDFRVGGQERVSGGFSGGAVSSFHGHYLDIVPDRRIVYAYDMHLDGRKISVSLATVEFIAVSRGTRLVFTEQLVYLDGYDDPNGKQREEGSRSLLDNLDAALRQS